MTRSLADLVVAILSSAVYALLVYFLLFAYRHRLASAEVSNIRRRVKELEHHYTDAFLARGVFDALRDTLRSVSNELAALDPQQVTLHVTHELSFKIARCILNVEYLDHLQETIHNHLNGMERSIRYLPRRRQENVARCLQLAVNAQLRLGAEASAARREVRVLNTAIGYLQGVVGTDSQSATANTVIEVMAGFNRNGSEYLYNALCSSFEECLHFAYLFAQWLNHQRSLFAPLADLDPALADLGFTELFEPLHCEWQSFGVQRLTRYLVDQPGDLLLAAEATSTSAPISQRRSRVALAWLSNTLRFGGRLARLRRRPPSEDAERND